MTSNTSYTFTPRLMKCGHTQSWPDGVEQPPTRDCNACLIEDGRMTKAEVNEWWASFGVGGPRDLFGREVRDGR